MSPTPVATLLTAALCAACTPTVQVEAPEEPIRIEVTVRVKIEHRLESAFERNDALAGDVASRGPQGRRMDREALPLSPEGEAVERAKDEGRVGERGDGFLAPIDASPEPSVRTLVDDVNARRASTYRAIASENGVGEADVGALAGDLLIGRAGYRHWVQGSDGSWVRRE